MLIDFFFPVLTTAMRVLIFFSIFLLSWLHQMMGCTVTGSHGGSGLRLDPTHPRGQWSPGTGVPSPLSSVTIPAEMCKCQGISPLTKYVVFTSQLLTKVF